MNIQNVWVQNCEKWMTEVLEHVWIGTIAEKLFSFIHSHHLSVQTFLKLNPVLHFCCSVIQNSHFWWFAMVEQWNQRNFFYHRLCHLVLISPLHQSSQGPEIQADQSSYQLTPSPLPLFLSPQLSEFHHFPLLISFSVVLFSWALSNNSVVLSLSFPLFCLSLSYSE